MNKFIEIMQNVNSKRDVDIASDLFLRQLAKTGIKELTLKEAQQLGQITETLIAYYKKIYPDELKINQISQRVVDLFREPLQADASKSMNTVLIHYPREIIESLEKELGRDSLNNLLDLKSIKQIEIDFTAKTKPLIYKSKFTL